MNQWTFFNKKIEAFKAQSNDGGCPSTPAKKATSGRKRGPKPKNSGSGEEPTAQVVATHLPATASAHWQLRAKASTFGWVMVKSGPSQGALPIPKLIRRRHLSEENLKRNLLYKSKLNRTYASEEMMRGRPLTRETDEPQDKSGKSRKSDATERAPEEGRRCR
ncbi:meiotic activator RIM4 [Fusarium subglutinans]|uniref:Meiotic activator RIM4 n=1 Tax=Gibberella subglutinans TaxID=42677 RepID=A0A8H5QAV2_GIBSU|nr:meiotic activator RIM4 [Fusarium subglutinans]KAF5611892.1 meiotic activator RIM4 [Fusarium subglutinans]